MCGQISRGTGHNCPSSLIQMAVERCLAVTSDLSVYETNMNLLYDELCALGFTVVKPDGTFYIFPKALEEDAKALCRKAQKYDLALVPGDSFGCPGYFRMAYCIGTERSAAALLRWSGLWQRSTASPSNKEPLCRTYAVSCRCCSA